MFATVTLAPEGAGAILTHYVPYQLVGLGVVMVALGVLYGTCAFVGAIFRRAATANPVATSALAATPVVPGPPQAEGADPQVVAAIAAAITVALGQPCRMIDVQPAGHPVGMMSAWAIEGRFQHFSSHKVR